MAPLPRWQRIKMICVETRRTHYIYIYILYTMHTIYIYNDLCYDDLCIMI
jgi:hypothetical protein